MSDFNSNDTRLQISLSNQELIRLLKRQNKLVHDLSSEVINGIEEADDGFNVIRVTVTDIKISIKSLIILSFKWFIASIPVGIVIGILYALFIAISVGIN